MSSQERARDERLSAYANLRETTDLGVEAVGAQLGLSKRTAWVYEKSLKARVVQDALKGQTPPIRPAIPEGFEVRSIATGLDKTGNVEKQWLQVSPEATPGETIPDGHIVKGLSTLVDETGNVRAQWIKTRVDDTRLMQAAEAALKALSDQVPALPELPRRFEEYFDYQLATLYTMTDVHVGMLAWPPETHAAAWDLNIAEKVLVSTFCHMIDAAPMSGLGIVNNLGDFLHFDSLLAVTPSSGHVLDSDSRYQLVVQAAVRILERIIMHALSKHDKVLVYMNEGNHDMAGSVWLRVMFARVFRDNPRVTVVTNPNPYQAYQHGATMIGFHHGHLAKKEKLPLIFATQYSEMWGQTKHRYVHTGHYHEWHAKEHPGIIIEQHPTIASPDAYAARNGFMSKRQASAITYSAKHGEIGRQTFLPVE